MDLYAASACVPRGKRAGHGQYIYAYLFQVHLAALRGFG